MALFEEPLDCMTCQVIEPIVRKGEEYARLVFSESVTPALSLLGIAAAIWVVIMSMKAIAGDAKLEQLLKGFFAIVLASVFIGNSDFFFYFIYETTFEALGGLSRLMLEAGGGGGDEPIGDFSELSKLAYAIEQKVWVVLEIGNQLIRDSTAFSIGNIVAGAFITLTFFFMLALYMGHIGVSLFRILAVSCLAPWIGMAAAFSITRSLAGGGIKTLVSSVIVVATATAGMGITVYMIDQNIEVMPVHEGTDQINPEQVNDFAWSAQFFAVVLVGFMGIAWQWEAATIASGLSGVFLNSVGPALFAAGATALASVPMAAASRYFGAPAGRAAEQGVKASAIWTGEKLWDQWGRKMAEYQTARSGSAGGFGP